MKIHTRLALVKRGCPFCLKAIKAINYINKLLPDESRIRIVDNFEWEEFGLLSHPVINKFDPKTFDGYPYIYIDGIEVDAGETELLTIILAKLLQEELITEAKIGEKIISPI